MTAAWLLALVACEETIERPAPLDDAEGAFFDSPWPSQARTLESGAPDMAGFPGADTFPLIENYALAMEQELDGFSTNGPVYFRFDGPIDTALLPSAAESLDPQEASVMLVNLDPESPGFGELVPLHTDFQATSTTYQPENLLAFAPIPGAPLRPGTLYTALVTSRIATQSDGFKDALDPDRGSYTDWALLDAWLFEQGLTSEDIAIATRFRTQDPVQEQATLARHIETELGVQSLDQELDYTTNSAFGKGYEGSVTLPIWQHGERPYASEGGAFAFDSDGTPQLYGWERVTMSVTVPSGEEPEGGWPVVIYVHGTGGDWTSCCAGSGGMVPAWRVAQGGMMMIGVSQPLHGDRGTDGTDVELHSFNLFNPDSARANFRQGALDSVYLAHILSGRSHSFQTVHGEVHTDPDHVLYLGHSQGGVTGSMALPYLGDELDGAVLSGAGGFLSLSVLYRKQGDLDLEELVTSLLDFSDGETFDAMHPIAALLQSLADVTDPINYAPYWNQRRAWFTERPVDVLLFQGTMDEYTPPETSDALSAAAGAPFVDSGDIPEAHQVLGIEPVSSPVLRSIPAWGEQSVTSGMASYSGRGHFVIFELSEAASLYKEFLEGAVAGEPEIGSLQ